MTVEEAKSKWSDASTVVELKGAYVRDGNWQTIVRSLRHCSDTSTVVEQEKNLNGDTVVLVTPAGKSVLPPFLLVVK